MNKHHCLTVEKMPEGGFVVFEGASRSDMSRYCGPLFACSAIGDALAFVRDNLDPPANQTMKGQGSVPTSAEVAAAFPNGIKFKPAPGSAGDWSGA